MVVAGFLRVSKRERTGECWQDGSHGLLSLVSEATSCHLCCILLGHYVQATLKRKRLYKGLKSRKYESLDASIYHEAKGNTLKDE